MKDEDKTKEQLIKELVEMRHWITELETSEADRKRAEEQLRTLSSAVEQSANSIAILDREGKVEYVNRTFLELNEFSPEEVIGKHWRSFVSMHSTLREKYQEIQNTVVKRETTWTGEITDRAKGGEVIWREATIFPIKDAKGEITHSVYISEDITERVRAEEALRESEARLRTAIESLPFDFFIIDENGHYVMQNSTCRERWGDIIGKRPEDVGVDEDTLALWKSNNRRAFAGEVVEGEVRLEPEGKEGFYYNVISPVYDSDQIRGILGINIDITERKRAEEALRESETVLRSILNNSPDTVYSLDLTTHKPTFLNREKFCGYSRSELEAPGSILEVVHPDDIEALSAHWQQVTEGFGDLVSTIEYRLKRRDGAWEWIQSRETVLARNSEGTPTQLLVTLAVITERKQAEEELRKFKTISDRAGYGVAISGLEGNLLYLNKSFAQMHRYTADELIGKNLSIFHNEEQMKTVNRLKEGLRQEGSYVAEEVWHKRKDDTVFPTLMNGTLIRDEKGKPLFMAATAIDITERKRAEEQRKILSSVVEQSANSIAILDKEAKFEYVNPKLGEIYESTPEEAIGKHWRSFVSMYSTIREKSQEIWDTVIGRGTMWRGEVTDRAKSGELVWREATIFPIKDAKGEITHYAYISQDITERKQAEEALRRSLEETAHGQRLLLALSQAAQAVQRARTPDEVYHTIGDEVTRLGYHAIVFSLTDDQEHLAVSHLTFEPAPLQAAEKLAGLATQNFRFAAAPGGIYDRALTEGQAIFFEDVVEPMAESLPGLARLLVGRIAATLGLEQAICAPLTAGGEPHGLLTVTGTGLREADVPAVTAFANQAAIAIENARLYEAERTAREQLRNLADYLQTAREEERTHIAREIHDELGQALTALKMDLSWLGKRLPVDKPGLAKKAGAMSDLIDSAVLTVRRVATKLRPGLLDDLGLAVALEWQAQEFAERTGIDCELHLGDEDIPLDRDLATAIFRIFQETLTNVARYADATRVRVDLEDRPDELVLIVRDNGRGITESQISDPKSLGLIGMRERAHAWGGDVTFQGVPGQGTTVTVRIPRTEIRD